MKPLLLALPFILSFSAWGEVYKCDVNGTITYSQFSCGANAQSIEIKTSAEPAEKSASSLRKNSSDVMKDIAMYNRVNRIKRDISDHQYNIRSHRKRMAYEIKKLRYEKNFSRNNLAGATRDHALAEQMNAVTAQYNTLMEMEQRQIDRLIEEKLQLQNKSEQ